MTERVDFYVLKSSTPKQRWTFACRLTEKAYLHDLRVVLLSENAAEAEMMDEMLWTFNERSFVPHGIHGRSSGRDATPVKLTPDPDAIESADLLVNLSARLPSRLERFSRIAEIIDADDERRRLGRERFKAYRDLKLTVETHQLDPSRAPDAE
jgi:DNA polymerase III subunit chi